MDRDMINDSVSEKENMKMREGTGADQKTVMMYHMHADLVRFGDRSKDGNIFIYSLLLLPLCMVLLLYTVSFGRGA